LAGNHGPYLTKVQIEIPKPAQITSDFEFGNAPNDDAYRQVVYMDRDVGIPIEPILFVMLLFGVTAVVIAVVLRRRRRRMVGPPG
jgi:hypothetical protein